MEDEGLGPLIFNQLKSSDVIVGTLNDQFRVLTKSQLGAFNTLKWELDGRDFLFLSESEHLTIVMQDKNFIRKTEKANYPAFVVSGVFEGACQRIFGVNRIGRRLCV